MMMKSVLGWKNANTARFARGGMSVEERRGLWLSWGFWYVAMNIYTGHATHTAAEWQIMPSVRNYVIEIPICFLYIYSQLYTCTPWVFCFSFPLFFFPFASKELLQIVSHWLSVPKHSRYEKKLKFINLLENRLIVSELRVYIFVQYCRNFFTVFSFSTVEGQLRLLDVILFTSISNPSSPSPQLK